MDKLVFSGPEHSVDIIKNILGSHFEIRTVKPVQEALYPEFVECTVFLDASMKVKIPAEIIEEAKNLKLVITATTGANHIDQEALKLKKIPVLTLKDQKEFLRDITAAAEHSWLLLMSCARRLRGAVHHVEQAGWDRVRFPGLLLKGKTLGIIGFGRLGSWMARYAVAFDMNIQAYDPYVSQMPDKIKSVSLEELLSTSDFVSIHVHLSEETKEMLDSQKIGLIRPGCVLINTSRGELVDENALVEALAEGRIAAIGVDVISGEPDITNNPLWRYAQNHNNVIITPHIAGYCPDAVNNVVEFSCKRILDYFGVR